MAHSELAMPNAVPPLAFFCITALARVPDQLHHFHPRRIPANPALLDALPHKPDPCLWAALAQLVHPLPPHLHDHDLPLFHPDLHLLQTIPHSPDFALITLLSLPNCIHLRDDDVVNLRTLHCLLALDLRGCSISSYALTALTRGLAASSSNRRTGPWGLRLLSLHGCPNVDNDVLSALHKFPLLSAVDLRFTRCTPSAVNTRLSSLGFGPSSNKSLFHPASPSLALCTLEKIAHTTSAPISLFSCPSRSVFRLHIDQLDQPMSRSNKVGLVDSSRIPQTAIRTISSAEDTVVFIPPLRGPVKDVSLSLPKPSDFDSANITSLPIDRSTSPDLVSNVSSFYENAPARCRHVLPLSSQAVQSSKGNKSDQLAVARAPPPWKILDTQASPASPKPDIVACPQNTLSDNVENARQKRSSSSGTGQALDNPLKVDRARMHKRGCDSVADIVHPSKRIKIESEFTLAKRRETLSVKSCNPFVRNIRSVFAESSTKSSRQPPALASEPTQETSPGTQLRTTRSLPCKLAGGTEPNKPLRPITTLKPPILPKELLPSFPRAPGPRRKLKQTRLSFSREEEEGSEEDVVFDWGR